MNQDDAPSSQECFFFHRVFVLKLYAFALANHYNKSLSHFILLIDFPLGLPILGDQNLYKIHVSFELEYILGGGNSNIFYFHPYLGKISNLTHIFQMG